MGQSSILFAMYDPDADAMRQHCADITTIIAEEFGANGLPSRFICYQEPKKLSELMIRRGNAKGVVMILDGYGAPVPGWNTLTTLRNRNIVPNNTMMCSDMAATEFEQTRRSCGLTEIPLSFLPKNLGLLRFREHVVNVATGAASEIRLFPTRTTDTPRRRETEELILVG